MDFCKGTALFLIFFSYLSDAETRDYNQILHVPNGGPWGTWGVPEFCRKGYAVGFSLKVDPRWKIGQGIKDATSMNAIRLHCTDGSIVQSSVGRYGSWTKVKTCPKGLLISFSLRVLPPQGAFVDDTSADNIIFSCENGPVMKGSSTDWGIYGPWSATCIKGAICGLITRIDSAYSLDMTGLNDVVFFCCN